MALGDMEHDRPRLEQGEIAFFIGRNLPERMKRTMRGFLQRTERLKTNLVGLARFFEGPANRHVTRQSPAAIGGPFKGGDGRGHWKAPRGRRDRYYGRPRSQGKRQPRTSVIAGRAGIELVRDFEVLGHQDPSGTFSNKLSNRAAPHCARAVTA
jgi:hypothetical protein